MAGMPTLGYCGIHFGADPELFIREIKTQKVIPADTFLPSKNNKLSVNSGYLFFDGVQAEMNVIPESCRENLCSNIKRILRDLDNVVNKKYRVKRKYQLVALSSCKVDKKLLMKADPECRIFGCAPSRNAYTKKQATAGLNGEKHLYRYSGGHIHLGIIKPKSKERIDKLVKVLDRVVGVTTGVLLDNDQFSLRRRKYYGQAGEYRIQSHGIEYRTLSNFWMRSPMLTSLVFGLARVGYTIFHEGHADKILKLASDSTVRRIIANTDIGQARKLYNKLKPFLTKVEGPLSNKDGLSSFEYVQRMGLNRFFTRDLRTEWKLHRNTDGFGSSHGWLCGMHNLLSSDSSFKKFKAKFIKKEKNLTYFDYTDGDPCETCMSDDCDDCEHSSDY